MCGASVTHLRGKRNPVAFARRVILDYCFKDPILAEKVYTQRTEKVLLKKLREEYENVDNFSGIPMQVFRELGEVTIDSRGRGSFQQ